MLQRFQKKWRSHPSSALRAPSPTRGEGALRVLVFTQFSFFLLWLVTESVFAAAPLSDWPSYGGAPSATHYSQLSQINTANVKNLRVAWTYHTGDMTTRRNGIKKSAFESTPILLDNNLYFCTPLNRIVALNAKTGKKIWDYQPDHINFKKDYAGPLRCRGVAAWIDSTKSLDTVCQQRIYGIVIDGRVVALDAKTGHLCTDFGKKGEVDLNNYDNKNATFDISLTSPPAIFNDTVIVGSSINDNQRTNSPHGIVRALDARTGIQKWSWDPIPIELSHQVGSSNVWAPMSVDIQRGLVYLPTTSPSPDYYGGSRTKNIPYENSIVALDAKTGKPVWHFQVVHHNLWDYDLPSQPMLIDLQKEDKIIPLVAQTTKTGFIFFFDRVTGKPFFPIREEFVPQTEVQGEVTSLTQPFPVLPLPLGPLKLNARDAWGLFYFDRLWCRAQIAKLRNEGIFTPPSVEGTLEIPAPLGGNNWGGGAFDPNSGLFIVNTSNLIYRIHLFSRDQYHEDEKRHPTADFAPQYGTPYAMERELLASPLGIPCNPPPWGNLTAIDVTTGKVRWKIPFGSVRKGFFTTPKRWGSPTLGGPMVTAGGLVFIGASIDNIFHALNVQTGELLWEYKLPADGIATPMTYEVDGKQYVVIAAGGGWISAKESDALVAFTLADTKKS